MIGVDVLEHAHQRPLRLDLAEQLHRARQHAGVLAEDSDVAGLDDAVDDLVDDRTLARALRAVEQVAAAVQVAVALELVAQRPEVLDLLQDLRRQAVGEVDQVIDLEILGQELRLAVLVEAAAVGAGRQLAVGGAARLEDARHGRLSTGWASSGSRCQSGDRAAGARRRRCAMPRGQNRSACQSRSDP